MLIFENGKYREPTQDEMKALGLYANNEILDENSVLKQFAESLSNASSIADMREAAQQFLNNTNI